MNRELTLTKERAKIEKAKKYAKEKNRNLSDIIENYLNSSTKEEQNNESKKLDPAVELQKDSFTMPKDVDYNKELKNRLGKNYL